MKMRNFEKFGPKVVNFAVFSRTSTFIPNVREGLLKSIRAPIWLVPVPTLSLGFEAPKSVGKRSSEKETKRFSPLVVHWNHQSIVDCL